MNAIFKNAFHIPTVADTDAAPYLNSKAEDIFKAANIYEGGAGNDIMYATTAKDVFLYQASSGFTTDADTIHGFAVGTDKLFIMDQNAAIEGGYKTGSDWLKGGGIQRGFSTSWEFGTASSSTAAYTSGVLKVYGPREQESASAAKALAYTSLQYGFETDAFSSHSGDEVYIQFSGGNAIVTVSETLLLNSPIKPTSGTQGFRSTTDTLTITLTGVESTSLENAAEIASLFGAGVTVTATP